MRIVSFRSEKTCRQNVFSKIRKLKDILISKAKISERECRRSERLETVNKKQSNKTAAQFQSKISDRTICQMLNYTEILKHI